MPTVAAPRLEHVCDLAVEVGKPLTTGPMQLGERRLIPITGGSVTGPRLSGRILPEGSDVQILRADGVTDLAARYFVETSDGALIYVENLGLRFGAPDVMERLRRGEAVDPSLVYFRATPRFETAARQYLWMTQRLFLCTGVREPSRVVLSIYEVA
jgi:Protein of unknown function (DUF3237)